MKDRIRVTVQVIETEMGTHVWADRYVHELDEIFELQDEVIDGIVSQFQPHSARAEGERARAGISGSVLLH